MSNRQHHDRKDKEYRAERLAKAEVGKGNLGNGACGRAAKRWTKPYHGATVCQGCKRSGKEATRHGGKDSLCDECARLLHIGKEIMQQRERADKLFKKTMNAAQGDNVTTPDRKPNETTYW